MAVQLGSILLEDGAILETLGVSCAPASDNTVRALIKLVINVVRLLGKTRGGNVIIQNNRGGQLDEGKVKIVTEMTRLLIPMIRMIFMCVLFSIFIIKLLSVCA